MMRKPGISKATTYTTRIFSAEYDMQGMINAYGQEFAHWLIDEICKGRTDLPSVVKRWGRHCTLTHDYAFSQYAHLYAGDELSYPYVDASSEACEDAESEDELENEQSEEEV